MISGGKARKGGGGRREKGSRSIASGETRADARRFLLAGREGSEGVGRARSHLVHGDDVAEADAEVLADDLVHADLALLAELVREDDAHGVLALLALDEDGVAAEELQLVHLLQVERHDGVVIVHRLVCDASGRGGRAWAIGSTVRTEARSRGGRNDARSIEEARGARDPRVDETSPSNSRWGARSDLAGTRRDRASGGRTDDEAVGRLLALEDGGGHVFLRAGARRRGGRVVGHVASVRGGTRPIE